MKFAVASTSSLCLTLLGENIVEFDIAAVKVSCFPLPDLDFAVMRSLLFSPGFLNSENTHVALTSGRSDYFCFPSRLLFLCTIYTRFSC